MSSHRYSEIAPLIDIDAFEEAIGFEPIERDNRGNDRGHCILPWGMHKNGDTSGKFAIHRDKRVYNCWVCGGGSLLSLVMELKEMQEDDAIDWIGQFADGKVEVSDEEFTSEIEALLAEETRLKPVMPFFNDRVLEQWTAQAAETDWFASKGVSPAMIDAFRLGYNPEAKRTTKKGTYVGPGVIVPHFWNERLVGWQTRWLDDDRPKWIPKYTNVRDFPASETIYNYERVYFSPLPIVVCESAKTVWRLTGLEISSMATFGGEVSDEQLRLLRRAQQGVIIASDNDKVGRKFIRTLTQGLEHYISLKVTEPVGEEDSGDDLGDIEDDNEIIQRVSEAEYAL